MEKDDPKKMKNEMLDNAGLITEEDYNEQKKKSWGCKNWQ